MRCCSSLDLFYSLPPVSCPCPSWDVCMFGLPALNQTTESPFTVMLVLSISLFSSGNTLQGPSRHSRAGGCCQSILTRRGLRLFLSRPLPTRKASTLAQNRCGVWARAILIIHPSSGCLTQTLPRRLDSGRPIQRPDFGLKQYVTIDKWRVRVVEGRTCLSPPTMMGVHGEAAGGGGTERCAIITTAPSDGAGGRMCWDA
ncbi:hypothetical protein EDD85DRAFT_81251 [Armillaria nabsnona]|nr:hypothetical protein EDD85DRAFT_81251 [Armillaria nabsnona]